MLPRWRRLTTGSRLLLALVAMVIVITWYRILAHEDYGMFDQLDTDADPVYHNPREKVNVKSRDQQQTNIGNFPVLPMDRMESPSTPKPLTSDQVIPRVTQDNFTSQLKYTLATHSEDEHLLVVVLDSGFLDFGLNFIKGSVEPLQLKSVFVPICLDVESRRILKEHDCHCILLDVEHFGSHRATDFGTEEYYRKTNIKTWVVLQFLKHQRSVLLSDVDVVLFKNPFEYFNCTECDVEIQMDRQLYNSGFVFARGTSSSVELYSQAWASYLSYHQGHDQAYINMAITALTRTSSLQLRELSARTFPCGSYYFQLDYRHFYNQPSCDACVMAHNNYLGTTAAKVYRFKENLLWHIDHDGYYSSTSARYLTYENPVDYGQESIVQERQALLNGLVLAELTERTLILPSFRCCNCHTTRCDHPVNRCSLLSVLKLKTFDSVFKGKYREHSFLKNRLVPDSIKTSISPTLTFQDSVGGNMDISRYLKDVPPTDIPPIVIQSNVSISAIMNTIKSVTSYPVIRLHSIYGQYPWSDVIDKHVLARYYEAIQCGLYEQWEVSLQDKFFGKRKEHT